MAAARDVILQDDEVLGAMAYAAGRQRVLASHRALAARVADLEETLGFYADETNWTQPTSYGGTLFDEDAPAVDLGLHAREALGLPLSDWDQLAIEERAK